MRVISNIFLTFFYRCFFSLLRSELTGSGSFGTLDGFGSTMLSATGILGFFCLAGGLAG